MSNSFRFNCIKRPFKFSLNGFKCFLHIYQKMYISFCNYVHFVFSIIIMPSHVHLIFRSGNGDPSGLMRDFKGFTSKKMLKTIEENVQESRRE